MTGFECFYAIVTDRGHGSQEVGHGSQFRWVTGSLVTLLDPLPALRQTLLRSAIQREICLFHSWGPSSVNGLLELLPRDHGTVWPSTSAGLKARLSSKRNSEVICSVKLMNCSTLYSKNITFVFLHNSRKKLPIWMKISDKIANEMLILIA